MNRRKNAFRTLSISLFLSVFLASLIQFNLSFQLVIVPFAVLALILLISNLLFDRLFEKSKLTTIILTNIELKRKSMKRHDKWKLSDICAVQIKWTSRDLIREICLKTLHSGCVYINGLEEFESFAKDLTKALPMNVSPSRIKEIIDYDHPLFYAVLGSILGSISVLSMKAMQSLQFIGIAYLKFGVACFSLFVALFWFLSSPIAGRYGQKTTCIDIIISTLILLTCLYMIYLSKIWQMIEL